MGKKAYLQAFFQTTWLTIIVSNKATKILASKMNLNLNEPSKIADISWIKPQNSIGHNINTVKTGYVERIIPRREHHDGQWMVNYYQRVAETTAEYKIMLEAAHEPVHPTGLQQG